MSFDPEGGCDTKLCESPMRDPPCLREALVRVCCWVSCQGGHGPQRARHQGPWAPPACRATPSPGPDLGYVGPLPVFLLEFYSFTIYN